MTDVITVEELRAQLAERDQELARLRAEMVCWDSGEREQVAERLRQAEEQAQDLIRYAPTGIYEVDFRTGRFRTINDAMCEILGYTREELLGMSGFGLLDDPGKALFADRIRCTLAGEKVDPSVEYRVKKKDGSVLYATLSTRVTYHGGQPDGAFVIAHDVTERRRIMAEQEAVLAAIAHGLLVIDSEGRIVRLNAAAQHMLGFSGDERDLPLRERVASIMHPLKPDGSPCPPDDFPGVRALRGEVVTNQELVLHVPARGGGPLRVAISSAPIFAPDGTVTGAVSTFADVEAFHAVTEELRRAHDELEQRVAERTAELTKANEELRYQAAVLKTISDAVMATDPAGRITYLNPAAERSYGWKLEEAMGLNPVQLFHAEFVGTTPEGFSQQLGAEGRWHGEVIVHRKDGTSFYADATAELLFDENGKRIGAIGIHRDITSRKQTEAERERLLAERLALTESMQVALDELAASREELRAYARKLVEAIENERRSLARELHDQAGQSMSALKLSLARLRREVDGHSRHTELFDEVGGLVDRVMEDLHRLAVNLRPVSLDRYGLAVALEQYVEFYRQQSGLDVTLVALHIEEPRLPPDMEVAVYRVVQEALTNVLRHARAKHVGVMLERRGGRVICIVEDDGLGFDAEEALRRGRLGLVGMRERAEMLKGTFSIESAPGMGTTVYVDAPLPEN